jgi:hypothetical protein
MKLLAAPFLLLPLLAPAVSAAPPAAPETLAYETTGGIAVSTPPEAPPAHEFPGSRPAVAPDGTRLAWMAPVGDRPQVFVGALDGSGARQVTSDAGSTTPSWSPDGSWLAYADVTGRLRLARADGSETVVVGAVRGEHAVWSPDGRFLAVNTTGGVTVVDAAGRGPAVLTRGLRMTDWSSDGRQLLGVGIDEVRLYRLGDRTVSTAVTSAALQGFLSNGTGVFAASQESLYLTKFVAAPWDWKVFIGVLERWSLDGTRDGAFAPRRSSSLGLSVGGGERPAPAVTRPNPVTGLTATPAPNRVTLRFARRTAPDTAGVTVRYAVGTTPPATVTDGIAGGDSLASVFAVERLAPATRYSFSVFTRDWSGAASPAATATATTPVSVATALTFTGPRTLTYGEPATLSGRLVRQDTGEGVAGARVVLLGRHTGQPDRPLVTFTTDRDGRFVTRRLTGQAARYTVRYAGSGPLLPAAADTLVLVRHRITTSFSPSSRVAAHTPTSVTVTVSPPFPGGNVRVQQHLYEHGVNVLTRLDGRSRATVRLDTSRRKQASEVVVTPGARRNYLSTSTGATLTIY